MDDRATTPPIHGSCLCGGVTFEIDRVDGPVEFCHCNRCRKLSGSNALLTLFVRTSAYRLLTGRELVSSWEAPILHRPPPYRATFCSRCGSPVPDPAPQGDTLEIPAGALDSDPGVRPDKHIFVDLMPAWDAVTDGLPAYTRRELYTLRTGRELPAAFVLRTHGVSRADEDEG